jgi:hypothetical protein
MKDFNINNHKDIIDKTVDNILSEEAKVVEKAAADFEKGICNPPDQRTIEDRGLTAIFTGGVSLLVEPFLSSKSEKTDIYLKTQEELNNKLNK